MISERTLQGDRTESGTADNNFPIDPSPEDLQSNSTFIQLADQEFAEHRTGMFQL
jgi:hypothetical protein